MKISSFLIICCVSSVLDRR